MPIVEDSFGYPFYCEYPEIKHHLATFVDNLLHYKADLACATTAADEDPSCTLAQLYAATLMLFVRSPEQLSKYLTTAHKNIQTGSASTVTEREKLLCEALELWQREYIDEATDSLRAIALKYPRDLFVLFLCNLHYIYLGELQAMHQLNETLFTSERNDLNHRIYGMYAYGLEENGYFDKAEAMGRRGTEMAPNQDHPWAHHAVCHVMNSMSRLDEGVAWMEKHSHHWDNCNAFMRSHNWWHLSLLYLEKGHDSNVVKLFDEQVWGPSESSKSNPEVIANAVGLLWRADVRGVQLASSAAISERWEDIATYVRPQFKDHIQPFLSLHYLYALSRAGDKERAEELMESIDQWATTRSAKQQDRRNSLKDVCVPLAKGIYEYSHGAYDAAYDILSKCTGRVREIGGSNEQRVAFELTYLDTLIRTHRHNEAVSVLQAKSTKESQPLLSTSHALARCQALTKCTE